MQNQVNNHQQSDVEVVTGDRTSHTGPHNKRAGKKRTSFNIPNSSTADDLVEITRDIGEDSFALSSVQITKGSKLEDSELAEVLEKKSTKSVVRNASSRIKQVSREVKRLASLTIRPDHPTKSLERTESVAVSALKRLEFISKTDAAWDVVEKRFDEITAPTNGLLPRSRFGECIGMVVDRNKESKEFACELFDALARRRNISGDSINKAQLKECWDLICDQSFDSRLQTFFDMVDKNADGRITVEEVREIITVSASANKLKSIQNQADEYARLVMEELDTDNNGYILIENLEMVLLQGPIHAVRGAGETRELNKMLSEKLKPTQDHFLKRWYDDLRYFLAENWQRAWVLTLWIGIMAGLFTWKYIQYRNRAAYDVMGACVSLAKGAAETLKLNMALILLPVCRNTITWLRNKTKLGMAVPFDDNLNFHKVIAIAIGIGVGIHGISHLTCDFPRLLHATPEEYKPMEKYFGHQPKSYWYFVRGWEGVTGIIMVVLMAIAFVLASPWFRRNKLKLPKPLKKLTGFNAFWYSHHLFVIVYACLIIHGIKLYLTHEWQKKTTWMYLAFPVVVYAAERLIRAFRSSVKAVKILKVALYPGNVLALHMSKPHGFRYKSGQYIFINCAAVSQFEWHPFSITSAPMDDYVSVHIREAGDWTKQLQAEFSKVCQPLATGNNVLFGADCLQGHNNPNFPRLLIDGPYGAPTQDYKDYDVVLLVGLGIGATPMISVVKDILNNMKAIADEENTMEEGITPSPSATSSIPKHMSGSGSGHRDFKTRKAYFYWVTREQGSFDWFKGIMNEVAEMDHKGVIEMCNYCTSVYEEGDARCALINMLQSLNHAKNGVDVVSGTRVKSHFAKPNWRAAYKRIAINHPNSRVGVFYCGAPPPVTELRHLASDFSHKTSTKFEFHKENF